jgi:CDGSH-type Zn-finger protein
VPDKQPTWMSWQLMTHRGPGRWTKNHLTTDGRTMLCGCRKPDRNVFCEDGNGETAVEAALAAIGKAKQGRELTKEEAETDRTWEN